MGVGGRYPLELGDLGGVLLLDLVHEAVVWKAIYGVRRMIYDLWYEMKG